MLHTCQNFDFGTQQKCPLHPFLFSADREFFDDFWAFLSLFFRWIRHLARMTVITSVTYRRFRMACYMLLPNWSKWHSNPPRVWHDPLTLGSRCVENIEVRGAFVQSSRTTVKGERKNGLKVRSAETCSRHATKVRQCGKNLIIAAWVKKIGPGYPVFFTVFIYQMNPLICACILQKESAQTVQNYLFQRLWWHAKCGNKSTTVNCHG